MQMQKNPAPCNMGRVNEATVFPVACCCCSCPLSHCCCTPPLPAIPILVASCFHPPSLTHCLWWWLEVMWQWWWPSSPSPHHCGCHVVGGAGSFLSALMSLPHPLIAVAVLSLSSFCCSLLSHTHPPCKQVLAAAVDHCHCPVLPFLLLLVMWSLSLLLFCPSLLVVVSHVVSVTVISHIPSKWGGGCMGHVVIVHKKCNLETCQ